MTTAPVSVPAPRRTSSDNLDEQDDPPSIFGYSPSSLWNMSRSWGAKTSAPRGPARGSPASDAWSQNSNRDAYHTRISRVLEGAIGTELLPILRDIGVSESFLTNEEFYKWITVVKTRDPSAIYMHSKRHIVRVMKLYHNPEDTAKYLKNVYSETVRYFCMYSIYLVLIYATCGRLGEPFCMMMRLIMTLHLGFINATYIYRVSHAAWGRMVGLSKMSFQAVRQSPRFLRELGGVFFEVFIGWQLSLYFVAIFSMLYVMPIAFDKMALSSAPIEIYQRYWDTELPLFLRVVSVFV